MIKYWCDLKATKLRQNYSKTRYNSAKFSKTVVQKNW